MFQIICEKNSLCSVREFKILSSCFLVTIAVFSGEELKAGVLLIMYSFNMHFTILCTATQPPKKGPEFITLFLLDVTCSLLMPFLLMKYIEISLLKTPLSYLPGSQQVSPEIKAITHRVNFFEMFFSSQYSRLFL